MRAVFSRGQNVTRINKRFISITVVLFILSTAQTICLLMLTLLTLSYDQYFIPRANRALLPEPIIKKLQSDQNILNLYQSLSDSMIATTNLIADGLLIWRCFIIWNRRVSVIVLPSIILMVGTACGYAVSGVDVFWYLRKRNHPTLMNAEPIWSRLQHYEIIFTKGFLISSAVTNMSMSILIASRIWWIIRKQLAYRRTARRYMRLVYLITESGAVYSVSLLLSGILYSAGYDVAGSVVMGFQYQLVGIFPTMIIVLVALGKSVEQTEDCGPPEPIRFATNPDRRVPTRRVESDRYEDDEKSLDSRSVAVVEIRVGSEYDRQRVDGDSSTSLTV